MGTAGNNAPFMDQSDAAIAADEDRVRDRDSLVRQRAAIATHPGVLASIRQRIGRVRRAVRRP
jgi:hypothetical protein